MSETPTIDSLTEQLRPCPFCGGKAWIERIGTSRQSMQIACEDCGARMESGDVVGLTPPSSYAWNRRHKS